MLGTTAKSYFASGFHVFVEGYTRKRKFVRHGEVELRYPNGQRALQGEYSHGKSTGLWRQWYESGKLLSEHRFINGLLEGKHTHWYEDGDVARQGVHKMGHLDEVKIFKKRGRVSKHVKYVKGVAKNGRFILRDKEIDFDEHGLRDILTGLRIAMIPKKICVVSNDGSYKCKTPDQIWRDLTSFMDPEVVGQILEKINDMYAEFGLDTSKELFVSCSESARAIDVRESGPIARPAATHHVQIFDAELDEMMSACIDSARQANIDAGMDPETGPNPNAEHDQWVRDTVARIDEEIGNCREDSKQEMISFVGALARAALAFGRASWSKITAEGVTAGATVTGVAVLVHDKTVLDDGFGPSYDTGIPGVTRQNCADTDGSDCYIETNTNTDTVTTYRPIPEDQDGDHSRTTENKTDGTRTREVIKDGMVIRVEKYDADGKLIATMGYTEDEDRPKAPPNSGPGVDQPDGEDTRSRCERLQQRWDSIKDYCSQPGNNWQTYDCQQFLRIANGCVDAALILPTPDGDLTCPHRKDMTVEQLAQMNCEAKGWIMLPSGLDAVLCQEPSLASPVLGPSDPCLDPRAKCRPDMRIPGEMQEVGRPANLIGRRNFALSSVMHKVPAEHVPDLIEETFDARAMNQAGPTLVIFASTSCGPCTRTIDMLNDAAPNYKGKLQFFQVDVRQNPSLSERFKITHTPTLITFSHGQQIGQRRVGAARREILLSFLDRTIEVAKTVANNSCSGSA